MTCPKCNSELRPGAKFCTKCGQKLEVAPTCPQCSAPLKPGAKFCTKCGFKLNSNTEQTIATEKEAITNAQNDINSVNGRIYWNVLPGQIARVISESEFETYNKIQGVIVPEGTTAYIRANGKTIASISGGTYDFIQKTSIGDAIRRGWQMIVGLFSNKKNNANEDLYLHQQKVILENAKQGAAFSVIILLDKAFPLMIGAKHQEIDGYKDFVPMNIQTLHLTMKVGVNAYFKISNPEQFIIHYLTDKQSLNSALIAHEITDSIRMVLQDALYNIDLDTNRVPNELHSMIKDRINAIAAEAFFGLSVVRIVEISAENEDLARFAQLSQELYLSEKELDYLRRTNDFKNRLADEVNAQELHQCNSDLAFRQQLNAINRNRMNEELLHEDELLKFEHLLINERIVREARSDSERDAALIEISKNDLVRQEDLNILIHQIETSTHQRNAALAMMQLRDGIEFERVRLEGETEKATTIVKKELELQGLRDDYADSRFYKELGKQRAVEDAKLDLQQRQRDMEFNDIKRMHDLQREDDDAQFQQFMAMQSAEEQSRENQRRHEAELEKSRLRSAEEMERLKWENAQNLSDEKVWALSGGEGAVAYAQNKYNAERERETAERLEAQRRENEARLDAERAARDADSRDTKERMFEMMNNMINMTSGIQAQRASDKESRLQEKIDDRDRQLREREDRIRRQEGRMDTAYDRALDYTTRGSIPPQQQYQQPQQYNTPMQQPITQQPVQKAITQKACPECGSIVEEGSSFCENCGASIN